MNEITKEQIAQIAQLVSQYADLDAEKLLTAIVSDQQLLELAATYKERGLSMAQATLAAIVEQNLKVSKPQPMFPFAERMQTLNPLYRELREIADEKEFARVWYDTVGMTTDAAGAALREQIAMLKKKG